MNSSNFRNVLVVSQAFEGHLTGWAKHTSKLLDALDERSGPLQFSLLTSHGEIAEPLPSIVSEQITTPFAYGEGIVRKMVSGLAIVLCFLMSYRKWDLVYCSNFYFPVPLLVVLAQILGCRTVVRVAGQEVTSTGWRGTLRDAASRRADAIVVLNSAVREYLAGIGVADQTVYQIPNAVDTTKYAPAGNPENQKRTVRQLLCVAAVCERKGIHHVIEALARLRERTDEASGLHLTVVGPFNEAESSVAYTDQLNRLIGSHRLEESVTFTGRVDQVVPYYQEADVFLLPSYEEGMPNVLLEAMACQLPCIATGIPGVVDVVTDGETALLVQPGSAKDIADALDQLLKDSDLTEDLGFQARSLIEKKYSLDTMASRYRDVMFSQVKYDE